MQIVWRRLWAPDGRDPAWKSDGKTKRAVLVLPLLLFIVHYTGVTSRRYVGQPILPALRDLFNWAFANGKGDEYNYIITWDGSIYEWAGLSVGAHCSLKNQTSFGVLLMLAEGEAPTPAMLTSLAWLRQHLHSIGALTKTHAVDQHGQHFSTSCPGTEVKKKWAAIDFPLPTPTPPQPIPQPPVNREEFAMFWKVTDQPGWEGVAVIYWELAPGCLVNVAPSEAARYASRAGTTVEVWANSQQRLPWAEAQPLFFPRA